MSYTTTMSITFAAIAILSAYITGKIKIPARTSGNQDRTLLIAFRTLSALLAILSAIGVAIGINTLTIV